MNNIERRGREMLYISDDSVMAEQKIVRKLVQEFNTMDRSDFDGLAAQIKKILGKSENAFINPPFYCDYGKNIELGKNFFGNYNLTILDTGKVRIGDNCQCALLQRATHCMNTVLTLRLAIMSGSAETSSSAPVLPLVTML